MSQVSLTDKADNWVFLFLWPCSQRTVWPVLFCRSTKTKNKEAVWVERGSRGKERKRLWRASVLHNVNVRNWNWCPVMKAISDSLSLPGVRCLQKHLKVNAHVLQASRHTFCGLFTPISNILPRQVLYKQWDGVTWDEDIMWMCGLQGDMKWKFWIWDVWAIAQGNLFFFFFFYL